MIKITIPFPSADLGINGNKGVHWSKKQRATKNYRSVCHTIASYDRPQFPEGNIPISVMYYPPSNRGDLDNMLSRSKAAFDGIAEAWALNDKRFRPITIDCAPADKMNPRVEITCG